MATLKHLGFAAFLIVLVLVYLRQDLTREIRSEQRDDTQDDY